VPVGEMSSKSISWTVTLPMSQGDRERLSLVLQRLLIRRL
jgi:hypothetical protein